jgi:hypothetical protein
MLPKISVPVAVATAALALPLATMTSGPAIAAATRTLTVKVVDADGHPAASTDVELYRVGTSRYIDMGRERRRDLSPGTYNVAAWITTGSGASETYTLADQVVKLTASKTVVLDARLGKRVRVSLDNRSAQAEVLEIAPIIGGQWAFNPTIIEPPVGRAYVVPMRNKLMTLYIYTVWEKTGNTLADPSPFRYDILTAFHGAIPSAPVIRTRTSQLARVNVTVRAIDPDQTATLGLSPLPRVGPLPLNATTTLGGTPAHLVSYRTPGLQWQPLIDWSNATTNALTLQDYDPDQAAYGHRTYSEVWGAAVLAPQPNGVYAQVDDRELQAGLAGSAFPIGDALHPTDQGALATEAVRLHSGSKLLGHTASGTINVKIPDVRRQYRLTLSATRPSGSALSTSIGAVWKFMAKASSNNFSVPAQLFGMQILPGSLNRHNQAAGGSLTQVSLRVYSAFTGEQVLVPTVEAWASDNAGKTWAKVTVHRSGGHYVFSVRNAKAAGFTSLRLYVSDRHGNSEELTVVHAYAVS